MFCPKCSQAQASEDMRYCSRCGFPLLGVAELVASDGTALVKSPDGVNLTRRKNIVRGWAGINVLNLILAPFVVIGVQSIEAVVIYLFFSLVFLLGGFAWLIYTRPAQGDREIREKDLSLPPDRNIPPMSFGHGHQTNELLIPSSVTEGTTKLLDRS